jgi:hypothetical protein
MTMTWDEISVALIGMLTALLLIRHLLKTFSPSRAQGCRSGCCGGGQCVGDSGLKSLQEGNRE